MNRKISSYQPIKSLLLAGLLAVPMLALNAMADDNKWAPALADTFTDSSGNQYAYFNDPNNWSLAAVPANGDGNRVIINGTLGTPGDYVFCVVTNDMSDLYQLIMGYDGTVGGGNLIITNGAHVSFGVASGQWTGVGFPNGPSALYIGQGCSFTCGSHLWVGQGTNNGNPAQGTVTIDGGTLSLPNGQLGVGWNGNGGTNYITLTNGGKAFLSQWASPTLGQPGNSGLGIMNIADNSSYVVVTNNATGFFNTLVTNNQLIAYGGLGKITWNYNPVANITTINATAPTNQYTPVITAQPTNQITSLGGTASFHVQISNVPVNYQWILNGNPLTDGGGISGSKTATLTISGVTVAQTGSYFVMATNTTHSDQFVSSSSASLSTMGINLFPVITINGVPGNTYVSQYTASLTPPVTWTSFATNTVGSFAPVYVVDSTSPLAVRKFYQVIQQ